MSDVRIKLSAGAIILAVLHAMAMVGGFYAIHERPHQAAVRIDPLPLPRASEYASPGGPLRQPTVTAPPVNRNALDEIKQQYGSKTLSESKEGRWVYNPNTGEHVWCNSCGVPIVSRPQPAPPIYRPAPSPAPTPAPALPPSTIVVPASNSILQNNNALPPAKQYELVLFVGTDARSQQLLQWFNSDPVLRQVKAISNVQTLTKDNPLYRTRYVNIVRPEHFPAVVLQYPDGGHIHAAGGTFLPSSPQQLFADMRQGVQFAKQIREADRQMTGMIRTAGYSWDSAISPQMTLNRSPSLFGQTSEQDCVDGNCLRPVDGARGPLDRLFDNAKDANQALAWFSGAEIAITVVAIGIVVMFIMIARKLGA